MEQIAGTCYFGILSQLPMTCILSRLVSYTILIVVLGILLARVAFAIIYRYTSQLALYPKYFNNLYASLASQNTQYTQTFASATRPSPDPSDLFTFLLVTCYSEGRESIKSTLDSLALTYYDDSKKLLFVVADGLVTGPNSQKSTPEILLDLMQLDSTFDKDGDPIPCSYISIASGPKQHNKAKVYCGSYKCSDRVIPMILVVKCGLPEEETLPKPGNRGKRDSHVLLMSFLSKVALNDRMTPLDYDLFRKITHITHVTPDFYECCLMVDADTRVELHCLRYMINAMNNDPRIMGLCGETKISNKTTNWITKIQIFEYYISHHMGKAFESFFGIVTCLPGCFSMYRIKSNKQGNVLPILIAPDIVEQYSTNKVLDLHQKNLLLLGEDRFLTTLMLKTFPTRKTVFVSQAIAHTVVPEDFKTLQSQRRRWINSTVHNLIELAQVKELCGMFCFSMQVLYSDIVCRIHGPD